MKKPRTRTSFTSWQLTALEAQFQVQQYLVGQARRDFAAQLQLTEAQVTVSKLVNKVEFRSKCGCKTGASDTDENSA
jgi:hypothetical protein